MLHEAAGFDNTRNFKKEKEKLQGLYQPGQKPIYSHLPLGEKKEKRKEKNARAKSFTEES